MKTKIRRTRTQVVAFYVDEEEKAEIISAAQEQDMSLSDYCRKALMKTVREEVE